MWWRRREVNFVLTSLICTTFLLDFLWKEVKYNSDRQVDVHPPPFFQVFRNKKCPEELSVVGNFLVGFTVVCP